jgi:hypothetical protein
MLYRAGPNPLYDTLTYTSARDNAGWFKNEGTFDPITEAGPHARLAGHCWLETDDGDLIDLTPADWRAHFNELRAGLANAPPINWTVSPPAFFWTNADALKRPWRATGAPELGMAWYVWSASCATWLRSSRRGPGGLGEEPGARHCPAGTTTP